MGIIHLEHPNRLCDVITKSLRIDGVPLSRFQAWDMLRPEFIELMHQNIDDRATGSNSSALVLKQNSIRPIR